MLIRQRLGGVGDGSPTAPPLSEIDALIAEEAVEAAKNASTAWDANTAEAMQRKYRDSEMAGVRFPVAAVAAAAQETKGDPTTVDNKAGSRRSTQQDMMMMFASPVQTDGGGEASESTSCSMGKDEVIF